MFERFNGNFSYSKKLIAVKPEDRDVIKLTHNHVEFKAIALGNEAKTGLKYISLGNFVAYLGQAQPTRKHPLSFDDVVELIGDNHVVFRSDFKVFSDTSFWSQEREPLAKITNRVNEGMEILGTFMKSEHLPEGWDYWFSY